MMDNYDKDKKIRKHLNSFRKQESKYKSMFNDYKKDVKDNLSHSKEDIENKLSRDKEDRINALFSEYNEKKMNEHNEIQLKQIIPKPIEEINKIDVIDIIKEEIKQKHKEESAKKDAIISDGIKELNRQREFLLKKMQGGLNLLKLQSHELSNIIVMYRKSQKSTSVDNKELDYLLDIVDKVNKLKGLTYYSKFNQLENINTLVDISKNFHEIGSLMEGKVHKLFKLVNDFVRGDDTTTDDTIKLRLEKEISDIINELVIKIKEKPPIDEIAAYSYYASGEIAAYNSKKGQEGFGSGKEFSQDDIDNMFEVKK